MLRTAIGMALLLAMLVGIPLLWPDGFSEPPLVMVGLLAIAAVAAFVVGRRRRARS